MDPEQPIYLGTYHSAMRRYNDLGYANKKPGKLYKLRLNDSVKIHPRVVRDDYLDDASTKKPDRVVRYVNLFESVGSISLIARKNHFTIIDVKDLK